MCKRLFIRSISGILLFVLSLAFPLPNLAAESNNIYGIHITDVNEVDKAVELVNSNNGDWGYVTFTVNSNDRNLGKWQDRMNTFNKKRLIPIVRLTTFADGNHWTKPSPDDAKDWAGFLNKLYWPTKKRLVIVYNEPNHATEWGGEVNPREYAEYLKRTIEELKKVNKDFFILNAGFDASAPQQPPRYMDQAFYMDEMEKAVPGIFGMLDGWSSHSYPNPGFAGKPSDSGRGTIKNYQWELDLLKNKYKVGKDLPVYITETGWVYKNADHPTIRLSEESAADYTREAYEKVWSADSRVLAVTPFLLSYKSPLFSHFSWLQQNDSPTQIFEQVKSLPKVAGAPVRDIKSSLINVSVPSQIPQASEVVASITFKNTGNDVWRASDGIHLDAEDLSQLIVRKDFELDATSEVSPGQSYVFRFTLYTENIKQNAQINFQMKKAETFFGEKLLIPMKIYIPPKLNVRVSHTDSSAIKSLSLVFRKNNKQDVVQVKSVPESGFVGTFTSSVFAPGESTEVTVIAENRPQATQKIQISEGDNTVYIPLENEIPFWRRIFRL
jgi:hypothetical protein